LFNDHRFKAATEDSWCAIPRHYPQAEIDEFIVMPNHVHGIIRIHCATTVGARHDAPLRPEIPRASVLQRRSLGAIVLQFKSASAKRINELRSNPRGRVWQRNYYERVLRDERELDAARDYILDNPRKWDDDINNPKNIHRLGVPKRRGGFSSETQRSGKR